MAQKEHKNRAWLFYVIALLVFVVFLFVKRNNVVRWIQAGVTVSRQEKIIEEYQNRISDLNTKLEGLDNNADSLETFARETFFLSKPGEDIYITE